MNQKEIDKLDAKVYGDNEYPDIKRELHWLRDQAKLVEEQEKDLISQYRLVRYLNNSEKMRQVDEALEEARNMLVYFAETQAELKERARPKARTKRTPSS